MGNIIFFITGLLCGIIFGVHRISLWYILDDPKYFRWKQEMDKLKNERNI